MRNIGGIETMSKPIERLYYYEEFTGQWYLTTDKELAAQGVNWRDATLDDLDDLGAVGGFITNKILNIAEGYFEWNSKAITYDNGETYGDYEIVWDLKDRVLDRMEEMDIENSEQYEHIISFSEWKIYSLMDKMII
jgi:hypothetical protein